MSCLACKKEGKLQRERRQWEEKRECSRLLRCYLSFLCYTRVEKVTNKSAGLAARRVTNHKSQSIFYSSFYHLEGFFSLEKVTHKFIKKSKTVLPGASSRILNYFFILIILCLGSHSLFLPPPRLSRQCDMRYSRYSYSEMLLVLLPSKKSRWAAKQSEKALAEVSWISIWEICDDTQSVCRYPIVMAKKTALNSIYYRQRRRVESLWMDTTRRRKCLTRKSEFRARQHFKFAVQPSPAAAEFSDSIATSFVNMTRFPRKKI